MPSVAGTLVVDANLDSFPEAKLEAILGFNKTYEEYQESWNKPSDTGQLTAFFSRIAPTQATLERDDIFNSLDYLEERSDWIKEVVEKTSIHTCGSRATLLRSIGDHDMLRKLQTIPWSGISERLRGDAKMAKNNFDATWRGPRIGKDYERKCKRAVLSHLAVKKAEAKKEVDNLSQEICRKVWDRGQKWKADFDRKQQEQGK